jgi:hypothetical protein
MFNYEAHLPVSKEITSEEILGVVKQVRVYRKEADPSGDGFVCFIRETDKAKDFKTLIEKINILYGLHLSEQTLATLSNQSGDVLGGISQPELVTAQQIPSLISLFIKEGVQISEYELPVDAFNRPDARSIGNFIDKSKPLEKAGTSIQKPAGGIGKPGVNKQLSIELARQNGHKLTEDAVVTAVYDAEDGENARHSACTVSIVCDGTSSGVDRPATAPELAKELTAPGEMARHMAVYAEKVIKEAHDATRDNNSNFQLEFLGALKKIRAEADRYVIENGGGATIQIAVIRYEKAADGATQPILYSAAIGDPHLFVLKPDGTFLDFSAHQKVKGGGGATNALGATDEVKFPGTTDTGWDIHTVLLKQDSLVVTGSDGISTLDRILNRVCTRFMPNSESVGIGSQIVRAIAYKHLSRIKTDEDAVKFYSLETDSGLAKMIDEINTLILQERQKAHEILEKIKALVKNCTVIFQRADNDQINFGRIVVERTSGKSSQAFDKKTLAALEAQLPTGHRQKILGILGNILSSKDDKFVGTVTFEDFVMLQTLGFSIEGYFLQHKQTVGEHTQMQEANLLLRASNGKKDDLIPITLDYSTTGNSKRLLEHMLDERTKPPLQQEYSNIVRDDTTLTVQRV